MSIEAPNIFRSHPETDSGPVNATGHFWAMFAHHALQSEEGELSQLHILPQHRDFIAIAGQTIEDLNQRYDNVWNQLQEQDPNKFAQAARLTTWYLTDFLVPQHRLTLIEDELGQRKKAHRQIRSKLQSNDSKESIARLHTAVKELSQHIQTAVPFLTLPEQLVTLMQALNPEDETFGQTLDALEMVIPDADEPTDTDDGRFDKMLVDHRQTEQLLNGLDYYDDLLTLSPEQRATDVIWQFLVKYENAPTDDREAQKTYLQHYQTDQRAYNEGKFASLDEELRTLAPKVFRQRMRTSISDAREFWKPINALRQQLTSITAQIDQRETEKAGLFHAMNNPASQTKLDQYYQALDQMANALVAMVDEDQRLGVAQRLLTLQDVDVGAEKLHLVEQEIPVLSLEQLGTPRQDQLSFCLETLRWLGLRIDPEDVRNSRRVRQPDYTYTDRINPQLPGYDLTQRLYLASAFEEILTSPLLNGQQYSEGINAETDIASLGQFMEELSKLLYAVDPTQETIRQIKQKNLRDLSDEERARLSEELSRPELPAFMTTVFENFLHDAGNNILRPLRSSLTLLAMAVRLKQDPRQHQDDFNAIWQNGRVLDTLQYIVAGFQEEMIPGWGERRCDLRHVLETIGRSVAYRFNLQFNQEGEQISKPTEPTGTITMSVAEDIAAEIPIAAGVIYRIVYNFIKNTAKAYDEVKKFGGDGSPLAIDILAQVLEGNLLLAVRDNGPGFDLNVPLQAMARLVKDDPSIIQQIYDEVSPAAAKAIRAYDVDKHPYAIYPLTLEELLKLFLVRRLSGSIVTEQDPENRTSGIGLSAVRRMVFSVNGSIWPTNHPDGGAFVMVFFPLEKDATEARQLLPKVA